ncbi:hypothetical protein AL050_24265 [Pseudomonas syringae pv. daphniphylli]|uniref:hypothetical protein n=1 Tax=Pseudomonas syringae TaxID=317 RepID=UPI0005C90400|nr:hypothetical protein [Pseudomonas syringae]KWS87374.1 hypothetical protein AL050_24265 [Pseudomonas syringae pv. daphniphylli]
MYEILEAHGLQVVLANARDARAVLRRKPDVDDAQWIQGLHSCGLQRASFHPDREIAALRSYLRLRERHLDYAAAHIQHMQKALTNMNAQLHHAVSDITGLTGMRIIRAIVAGERGPSVLAAMSERRRKAGIDVIEAALVGCYHLEHLFTFTCVIPGSSDVRCIPITHEWVKQVEGILRASEADTTSPPHYGES